MRAKYFFLFLMVALLGCHSEQKLKNNQSIKLKQQEINLKINQPLKLTPEASTLIKNWKEYQNFKTFFNQFRMPTPSEALNNAKELNTLAQQLKDSIRNKLLDNVPFKARLDVLQNETMRLQDMVNIPNLKAPDIKAQINKILAAFNATNAKLNNLVVQKQIESDLDDLKLDSTKKIIKPDKLKRKQFNIKHKQ